MVTDQRTEPSSDSEKPKGKVPSILGDVAMMIVSTRPNESEACQEVL